MKQLIFIPVIFTAWIGISSCNLDEFDEYSSEIELAIPDTLIVNRLLTRAFSSPGENGLSVECYTIPFPFSIKVRKDSILMITTVAQFEINTNQSKTDFLDFIYPLKMYDNLGDVKIVQDIQEFAGFIGSCLPLGNSLPENPHRAYNINHENSCYSLVFPMYIQDIGGTISKVNNEKDLTFSIADKLYFFHFPLNLRDQNGKDVTILNGEMLFQSLLACNGSYYADSTFINIQHMHILGCYKYVFPFQVKLSNRETPFIVENENILAEIYLLNKFESFIYPLLIEDFSGIAYTINSEDELNKKIRDCYLEGSFPLLVEGTRLKREPACYELVVPVTATTAAGNQKIYYNYQEIKPEFSDTLFRVYTAVFPLKITKISSSETITLMNVFDLLNLLADCE